MRSSANGTALPPSTRSGPDEGLPEHRGRYRPRRGGSQRVHAYGLPDCAEATWSVKDVTRLGDLGGGQATIFLPLARLQDLVQRQEQVNQVLVINAGDDRPSG